MSAVELPPDLTKALVGGNCVIFIGAGVSHAAGVPCAADAAAVLEREIRQFSGTTSQDLLALVGASLPGIATLYRRLFPNYSAKRRLCETVQAGQAQADRTIFELLSRIPTVHYFVTTNWDTLVEDSFPFADRRVIRRAEELPHIDTRLTNILKIHGDVNDPENIVVDLTDYDSFERTSRHFVEQLRVLGRNNVFLFVGYGLDDDNVRRALKDCGERTFYYVTLDGRPLQEEAWKPITLTRIPGDAIHVCRQLVAEYERRQYIDTPRIEPAVAFGDVDATRQSHNPFELYETELMAERFPNLFAQYFVQPVKFDRVMTYANTVLEGHRGSGKSMILRYLSLLHEPARAGAVPFWGFYVKLEGGFFDAVVRETMSDNEWVRYFQHYFNLVVLTGVLRNIAVAIEDGTFHPPEAVALTAALKRIADRNLRLAVEADSLEALCDALYYELDSLRDDPSYRAFATPPRVVREVISALAAAIPELATRDWCLLLDEWDNLSHDQQRAVVMRLHDRDPRLRYKLGSKTLGFKEDGFGGQKVDFIHDYIFMRLDHHLFSPEEKGLYLEFLTLVGDKRLSKAATPTVRALLPRGVGDRAKRYDYSGFEHLAMLSSGVAREFLEICKDALYYAQPALISESRPVEPIPPKWQNHAARIHSAIHLNNVQGCKETDEAMKLITAMGSVFRQIDRATRAKAERRHPLTFDITDFYSVPEEHKSILRDTVSNRLIQLPELPLQPRNVWEGPKQKFTIHRLLAPYFGLSVYERYTVPVNSEILAAIFVDPKKAIKDLTRAYAIPEDEHDSDPSGQPRFW